jgi:hypothetical protein
VKTVENAVGDLTRLEEMKSCECDEIADIKNV